MTEIRRLINLIESAGSLTEAVDDNDYRGEHEAPDHLSGAPMHDLTANGIYPDDFYSHNGLRYYGDSEDPSSYYTAVSMKNKPNGFLKVYRAVPNDKAIRGINPGDWVTPSRRYAKEHGVSHLQGSFKVVSKTVRPRDLFTDGNSLQEWGYDPQPPVRRQRPLAEAAGDADPFAILRSADRIKAEIQRIVPDAKPQVFTLQNGTGISIYADGPREIIDALSDESVQQILRQHDWFIASVKHFSGKSRIRFEPSQNAPPVKAPRVLYHFTFAHNEDAIRQHGLMPKASSGEQHGYAYPARVYLANNLQQALELLKTSQYSDYRDGVFMVRDRAKHLTKNDFIIVKVDPGRLPPETRLNLDAFSRDAMFTTSPIPPEALTILHWDPTVKKYV